MIPWAPDRWWGEDKLTHAVYAYAGTVTGRLLGVAVGPVVVVVSVAGLVVEVVQWWRWAGWTRTVAAHLAAKRPPPRAPPFASPPSYRDLAWNTGGVVVGLLFHWLATAGLR